MRKLASIRIINQIITHPNADSLDIARIGGWQVVVKRGQFRPGDICVYCEIDSVLPDKPPFAFLKDKGFRIKTVKLRGQISQGICFAFEDLRADYPEIGNGHADGDDITAFLSVVKYEPPQMAAETKGDFPGFIEKTDAERVQNLTEQLAHFATLRNWVISEKLDGTSFTCFLRRGEFGVCSRNFELLPVETNTYWKIARALDLEGKLRGFGRDIAIQGEIVGASVQGNKYRLADQRLFVFRVIDIESNTSLDLEETCARLGLATVPILTKHESFPWKSVEEIIAFAAGSSTLEPVPREGLVIRTSDHSVLFKAISNEFLLKHGE